MNWSICLHSTFVTEVKCQFDEPTLLFESYDKDLTVYENAHVPTFEK